MINKVKICGLTQFEDAALASKLGAWALGFIFWSRSKRYVTISTAKEILNRLKSENLMPEKTVGVFVNASQKEIHEAVQHLELTTVQLHGDESEEFCKALPFEVIKAFRPDHADKIKLFQHYQAAYYLIDAHVEGAYGGTGHLSDWDLAIQAKQYGSIILSGGINADNAAQAFREVKPFAVDLASGVESSPGVKCHDKLKRLFNHLK